MRIACEIESADIEFIIATAARPENMKRIKERRAVQDLARRDHSDAGIWRAMMVCLLTTRQRSTTGTRLNDFCAERPFQLDYHQFRSLEEKVVGRRVAAIISKARLWRAKPIGDFSQANFKWLRAGGFSDIRVHLAKIASHPNADAERYAAGFLAKHLKGIGPKQSRNMLLNLGVLHYEVPIDSRVMGWLRTNLARSQALPLSDKTMADPEFYGLVMDQIRKLAGEAKVTPADLDAIMFADGKN